MEYGLLSGVDAKCSKMKKAGLKLASEWQKELEHWSSMCMALLID
jgi:hypothetical protein